MHLRSLIPHALMSLLCIACGPSPSRPTMPVTERSDEFSAERAFVQRFQALANAFDPAGVDLYADDVVVASARTLPDGTVRSLELRGADVKKLFRQALPIARAAGDKNRYSDLRFERGDFAPRATVTWATHRARPMTF